MSAEVVEATLEDVTSPDPSIEARLERIEVTLNGVANFCQTLAAMLDGMAANPMIAAMMPPGIFPEG